MQYVIGDCHGCGMELEALLSQMDKDLKVYAVGDLFDRGINCYKVWEIIHDYKIKAVMGNHEKKMLDFLTGKRSHLPPHYYYAINQLFDKGVSKKKLIKYLSNMPKMIRLTCFGMGHIIAHAGIDPSNPYSEDERFTVYGGDWTVPWYERYDGEDLVIYGHLSDPYPNHDIPRLRKGGSGGVNSIGLDTCAVNGGALTAYCIEQFDFIQIPCKWDYAGALKADLDRLGKPWREQMREKLCA